MALVHAVKSGATRGAWCEEVERGSKTLAKGLEGVSSDDAVFKGNGGEWEARDCS